MPFGCWVWDRILVQQCFGEEWVGATTLLSRMHGSKRYLVQALNTISFVAKPTIQWQPPPCDGATCVGFWPGGLWRNNECLRVFQRYSTKIGWIDLEKVWWAGYCENDYSGLLFPMKAWLFFSVALLVYGFVFESTFAKDKSPTLATLGAALVAGSLMWVVWRIN